MKFEEKLVSLRREQKLSQEQLAEKLGVSRQAVSRWEAGSTTPDMLNIIGLCEIFQVSADYLIREEAPVGPSPAAPADKAEGRSSPRRNPLLRLISGAFFQFSVTCFVVAACLSDNMLASVLLSLCAVGCCALTSYQLVSYGKTCGRAERPNS